MENSEDKKKIGLNVPNAILAEFNRVSGELVDDKQKWMIFSAAIIAYLGLSDFQRRFLLGKVGESLALKDGFAKLSQRAAAGEIPAAPTVPQLPPVPSYREGEIL